MNGATRGADTGSRRVDRPEPNPGAKAWPQAHIERGCPVIIGERVLETTVPLSWPSV